ncbi:MAG: hypothetical protein J0H89_12165 [Rhizobiales bacterium]|nr:hypothetical protein [Hyphomicrobiales bacterium]
MRSDHKCAHYKCKQVGDWEVVGRKLPPPPKVNERVSPTELKVLKALAEIFWDEFDWRAMGLKGIASHAELDIKKVRRPTRALARKGLAAYERFLVDDEGRAAGAGYRATVAGKALITRLEEQEEEAKHQASLI